MNRKEEFDDYKNEINQMVPDLSEIVTSSVVKAKKSRRRSLLLKTPLITLGTLIFVFVFLVNTFPGVALAMSNIPVLKELVSAVAFDPSLKSAVDHEYYQRIGKTQTQDDVALTVDYMIQDAGHISLFYKLNTPARNDELMFEFYDLNGNKLPASISWGPAETGKLNEIKIDFIGDDVIPKDFLFIAKLNISNNVLKNSSNAIPYEVPVSGIINKHLKDKEYTFRFKLNSDKKFTQLSDSISIHKWVEVKNQRIYLDKLDIYPTQSKLYIECDKSNSSYIKGMDICFKDNKGNIYNTNQNGVSAVYESNSENVKVLYCESSYFADAKDLILYINGISMIDKNKLWGMIDYSSKKITNMPEGVSIGSMELKNSTLKITLDIINENKNIHYSVIDMVYCDLQGKTYNLRELETYYDPDEDSFKQTTKISNYKDHKYKIKWNAHMQPLDKDVAVQIK